MVSSHNGVLVTLSILIAVAASYTALDIAQRVRESSTRISRTAWLAAAALCMGGGSGPCISSPCWPIPCRVS